MTESKLFSPGVLDGVLYTSIILDLRELRGVCFCVNTRVCGCKLVDGSCREDIIKDRTTPKFVIIITLCDYL